MTNDNGQLQMLGDPDADDFEARAQKLAALTKTRRNGEPTPPLQLPIWAEPERLMPNAMLRSALFSCARRRVFAQDVVIASWPDTVIRFNGETLNQFDESVWMQLIHMFRQQGEPEDLKVHFNAKPFLRAIGKAGKGGGSVAVLRASMIRLRGGTLLISHKGMEYGGGVLHDFTHDEDRGHFVATLNPKYLRLLGAGHTRLEWETRLQLPTGITTWLHRYILSQRATKRSPHRIGIEKLHRLSGMSSTAKEFKRVLQQAMVKLQELEVVFEWSINANGTLAFVRPPKGRKG